MHNGFSFGDKATWDYGMHVEKYPRLGAPGRKQKTYSIPGRSGDLHVAEDAWENYPQAYEVYFRGSLPSPEQAHAVKAWLFGCAGYRRLHDTYDPKYYRMAVCKGPMDIENILNKYGRCKVYFDCAPQSFLVDGDNPVQFEAAGQLYNGTSFEAKPIITAYGNAAGTVTVGTAVVEIKEISDPIILDCEMMQAYSKPGDGAAVNRNRSISAPEFPTLAPGANPVAFTGGITKLEIIPRWWTL